MNYIKNGPLYSFLKVAVGPIIKLIFNFKVTGLENIPENKIICVYYKIEDCKSALDYCLLGFVYGWYLYFRRIGRLFLE